MGKPVTTTIRFHDSLGEIDATAWNALLPDDNPFLDHAFLGGLERHGCLREKHGWLPHHLALYEDGRLAAAAPLYLKGNSHGEYVFDWSWANAYARSGLDYYPKLLCAVPYAPVTGARLLAPDGERGKVLRSALGDAIRGEVARNGLSSAHVNFVDDNGTRALSDGGWLPRFDWQFHWENRGWRDFADFLDALTPKKRKNIRQERARVERAGIHCEIQSGNEIDAALWKRLHTLYAATFDEKGNFPALTPEFFEHLGRALPQRVLAVLAWREGMLIAMALLLRSRDTLYGRYWGCNETIPGLHFEVCYYQGIDYCLREGLHRFEPGAQGEHKLARGFLPAMTRSFHYLEDLRFRAAVAESLVREGAALRAYHQELLAHSPYAEAK